MFETPFGPVDEQTKSMQKFIPNFGETIKIIGSHWKPMDESSAWDEKVETLVSIGYRRGKAQRMADVYYERPATASDITMTRQERIGGVVIGLFLVSFGTPFVLMPPWLIWPEVGAGSGLGPILICFPIPFIFAGGLVIWIGGHLLVGSIRGVQRTHPVFGSTRGVQVTNRSQDIEGGMEDSGTSNDETSPTRRPPTRR